MKIEAKTETEMRDEKVPWPKGIEELNEYLKSLTAVPQEYGTSVYIMSMAATAAFYYAAHVVGASGFQASCADLDILRRTRHIEGGFKIICYDDLLYPQNVCRVTDNSISADTAKRLQEQAQKHLLGENKHTHPGVLEHWTRIAGGHFPVEIKEN